MTPFITTKKATLWVALLSTLSLTACITDGDHQVKHINPKGNDGISANVFSNVKVTTFDVQYADNNNINAIVQTNMSIKSGQASYIDTPIFGKVSNEQATNSKPTLYALTDLFNFIITPDMKLSKLYVPKSDLEYYYDWHDNGSTIRHKFDYQAVDIAHISGVDKTAIKGVNTLLNNLPKTKQHKFDFPNDAKCYTLNQSINKSYFSFSSHDITNYTTLADWQQAMMTASNTGKFIQQQVGKDNASSAIYYNQPIYHQSSQPMTNKSVTSSGFVTHDSQSTPTNYQYPAVVQYKGKIYNATYNKGYDIKPNHDPDKGLVECQAYNKVASDYISQQIAKYYR